MADARENVPLTDPDDEENIVIDTTSTEPLREAIIEDPGVLTGPFVYRSNLRKPPETRIMEYECLENNINLNSIVQ